MAHNCGKIELSLAFYSQHGTLKVYFESKFRLQVCCVCVFTVVYFRKFTKIYSDSHSSPRSTLVVQIQN